MADDLGARLVQAGLITREQLARVLGASPRHEGALASGLVDAGLNPEALAGFFVAAGFGPLMQAVDLANAEPIAAAKITGEMATELLALPIYDSPAGLVVAMAAPSDRHAVSEIGRAASSQVLPTAARVTELRSALALTYPDVEAPRERVRRDSDPPVLELVKVRRRADGEDAVGQEGYRGSTRGAERVEAMATVGVVADASGGGVAPSALEQGKRSHDDGEDFVPLVRTKPVPQRRAEEAAQSFRKKVITKNFERPTTLSDSSPPRSAAWDRGPSRRAAGGARPPTAAASEEITVEAAAPVTPSSGSVRQPLARLELKKHAPYAGGAITEVTESRRAERADEPDASDAEDTTADAAAPAPSTPSVPPGDPSEGAEEAADDEHERLDSIPVEMDDMDDVGELEARPRSIIPFEHDSWNDASPVNKVSPDKLRSLSERPRRPARPAPIGGTLAAIRASRARDEVVELACQGALTVARAAVLLALRKGVLKGWDGAGASLSRDAVRNLWIPTNSPSMFRDVVSRRQAFLGPPGSTAADGLFRAALGSRGGDVALLPVLVGGKLVGVFAADDLRHGREGTERIEILARAIGEAFERIIVRKKH